MRKNAPKYTSTQTIIKTYPRKIQHIALKHAILSERPKNTDKRLHMQPEEIDQLNEENAERSLRRTQKELQDLVDCNNFEWFGTFTFDPAKIDRHDPKAVKNAMSIWLNNQRRHSPDMLYILVPERHKDGAIHFHALLGNYNGKMAHSGSEWQKQPIFNVVSYQLGFTNFTKIRDKAKTANYCRKYITKDMANTAPNERRYWRSKNLLKPVKTYNESLEETLQRNIASIDIQASTQYENDHIISHTFPLKGKNTPDFTPAKPIARAITPIT